MNKRPILNKLSFLMVFVILGFTTIVYGAVHQAVIGATYVLITLTLLIAAIDAWKKGDVLISSSALQYPIYAAALYGVIQVIPFGTLGNVGGVEGISRTISLDPFATQVSALHFLFLGAFFSLLLSMLDSASRLRKLAVFITIFGFAFAFFAILQSVLSPTKIYGILERSYASPFGSFVSRNNFAGWMELSVAIPLGLLLTGAVSKEKRLLYITGIAVMVISIVVSGSRGGLVAFIAEIAFLLFLTFLRRQRSTLRLQMLLAGVIIAAVIGGTAFVGGETSLTRLAEGQDGASQTDSRAHIWSVSVRIIGNSMPLGVGLGAYGMAYSAFDKSSGLQRVEQAHNDYLQVLTDAGLVGALIGTAFIFFLFRTGREAVTVENQYRQGLAAGALAGVFGVLVHSLFDFVLHTTAIALLFLTLVAILSTSKSKFADDLEPDKRRRSRRSVHSA